MSSPWLSTADAADYLRYSGKHPIRSVYKFIKRHGIVPRHDGGRLLLARADVERALEEHRQPLRPSRQLDQPFQSRHAAHCAKEHSRTHSPFSGQTGS